MATYNLNITQHYCSDWGFWEAIREIIQNGEDQERTNPENSFSINYNPSKEILTFSNKESILERSTILMGKTTKKGNEDLVGQYGEGYKVALAVLTRLGKKVVIKNFNKNEKWTPIVEADKLYDGESVLKLKIEKFFFKKVPDHNLTWDIHNVSQEEFDSISNKYLPFLNIEESDIYNHNKSSIIFHESCKNKIFVNGLFVQESKTPLEHGYNFHPSIIKLDRDRRSVENFDLFWNSSRLFQQFSTESIENSKYVYNLIKNKSPETVYVSINYSTSNLQNVIVESFSNQYGDNAYPVSSQEESEKINKSFPSIKSVFVTEKEKEFLQSNEKYSNLANFSKQVSDSKESLTPTEILSAILIKYQSNMEYNLQKEFESVIELSKHWKSEQSLTESLEDEIESAIEENDDSYNSSIEKENYLDDIPF